MSDIEDVIIIGGGPAGLAAAVYTSRANLSPMLFGGAPYGGQLMLTSEVENYPGFDHILGPELIEKMREHTKKFGTKILDQNIIKLSLNKSPFEVETVDKKYLTKSIIIATGAKALWLELENERRLRGKGVSACATCDGFFFKDRIVAVVGGGDSAMEESLFLTKFASKIYIVHRRGEFRASKIMQDRVFNHSKIEVIWNTEITDVLGQDKVEGVKLKDKDGNEKELKTDGLFLAIGHKPDTDIFKDQIILDRKGYVVTSERFTLEYFKSKYMPQAQAPEKIARTALETTINGENLEGMKDKFNTIYNTATSVSGVFAAGDCVDFVYRQAATAAGKGVVAALEVEKWLEDSQ